MTDFLHPSNDFLKKVIAIIEENLSDDGFEVPDLAQQLNMSRSNLLRKVKSLSGYSVSVFIRQVRLHHAKKMLKNDSLTVSEVAFKVGFSSTSYFTKCFRESFGYPPGEERSREMDSTNSMQPIGRGKSGAKARVLMMVGVVIAVVLTILFSQNHTEEERPDKSIAVLPFENDSDDSSNIYFINGLMETILDNLQKIEDLDVTSRTTVEQYRGAKKSVPELSRELDVGYIVEGSGQKLGNKILLTIQLIDAKNDRHVWSQQYEREVGDIFKLQQEVAKSIAGKIQAIITPDEQKRIEKIPTENLIAYDYYLQGLDLTKNAKSSDELLKALPYFKDAIALDETFALAYAYIAICYYYLDIFHANKQYGLEINTYADKALLYDEDQPESLIAKALYYWQDEQYELAAKYFEKVLKISPNSGWVHNQLSGLYADYIPDIQRYLAHALQGIRVAISDQDSIQASYTYLHLSNALVENGFIKEAEKYVLTSLDYNSNNLFSEYVLTYIRLAQNFDLERAKNELIATLAKDTMRVDILQEIGKVCYTMEDYEEAWVYYKRFLYIKRLLNLDIYRGEDVKIAFTLEQLGRIKEAEKFYDDYIIYAENDQTIYKSLSLSAYYASKGDVEEGMKYLQAFTKERDYSYWIVLFLEKDPIILKLSSHSDFTKTLNEISDNFWRQHREIRKMLEEEGVI